jgi:predicted Zn-ribbon and HTH transcriptional regulator
VKKINTIECTRCKWQGVVSDLVEVKNVVETEKYGLVVSDAVCPNCGCKTTYNLQLKT